MARFVTRPYRYANGVAYRPNLFLIHPFDETAQEAERGAVGGIIKAGDRWFAFAAAMGAPHLVQDTVERIKARCDSWAWADSKAAAAAAIKPHLGARA